MQDLRSQISSNNARQINLLLSKLLSANFYKSLHRFNRLLNLFGGGGDGGSVDATLRYDVADKACNRGNRARNRLYAVRIAAQRNVNSGGNSGCCAPELGAAQLLNNRSCFR
jgi:hypothetical protein